MTEYGYWFSHSLGCLLMFLLLFVIKRAIKRYGNIAGVSSLAFYPIALSCSWLVLHSSCFDDDNNGMADAEILFIGMSGANVVVVCRL